MSSVTVRMCIFLSAENIVLVQKFVSSHLSTRPYILRCHGSECPSARTERLQQFCLSMPAMFAFSEALWSCKRSAWSTTSYFSEPCDISEEPGELLQRLLGLKSPRFAG